MRETLTEPRWTAAPPGRWRAPWLQALQELLLADAFLSFCSPGAWLPTMSSAQLFPTKGVMQYSASLWCVRLFATGSGRLLCPWEYWSGLPLPSSGDPLGPGIDPGSPELQVDSLPSKPPGKPDSK